MARGLPERGDSEILQSKITPNLTVVVWQDTKVVTACATNAQGIPLTDVQRKHKKGQKISVPCPEAIALYNTYMGGVDLNDQLCQYYNIRLKFQKHYFYLMWFFFDVAITNSYILARNYSYLNIKCVKDYHLQLAKVLIGQYLSRKRKGKKSTFVSTKTFKRSHFPVIGDGKQYRCYHCSRYKHLQKDIKWK